MSIPITYGDGDDSADRRDQPELDVRDFGCPQLRMVIHHEPHVFVPLACIGTKKAIGVEEPPDPE